MEFGRRKYIEQWYARLVKEGDRQDLIDSNVMTRSCFTRYSRRSDGRRALITDLVIVKSRLAADTWFKRSCAPYGVHF